jgi:hypothetical protein
MECSRAKELLSDYLDGILDSRSGAQLEMHLSGCTGCRQQHDALKALVSELNSMEPVKSPPDFLDQIHERLESRSWRDTIFKTLFFPLRIKLPLELAAAAVMAFLIIGVIGIQNKELSTQQPPRISITQSAVEKKQDSNRVSRRLKKAQPTLASRQPASDRKENQIQPIVLAMVVKPVKLVPAHEISGFQQDLSERSPGKAAGVADEEKGSVSYFSTPQRASEMPAQDAVKSVAPEASVSKDNRQLEEKGRLNLKQTRYRVKKLVQALEGHVLYGRDDQPAPDQRSMTVNIPAARYNEFVGQLGHIAPFHTPPPSPPKGRTLIRVEIRFISSNL